jgi:hypothetical protein
VWGLKSKDAVFNFRWHWLEMPTKCHRCHRAARSLALNSGEKVGLKIKI